MELWIASCIIYLVSYSVSMHSYNQIKPPSLEGSCELGEFMTNSAGKKSNWNLISFTIGKVVGLRLESY